MNVPVSDAPYSGPAAPLFLFAETFQDVLHRLTEHEIIFMDFETTGFDTGPPFKTGSPVQIGMVRVRGGRVDGTFAAYMNPGEPLGSWAQTNLKNSVGDALTNEWLQTQRHFSEVLPESLVFLGSARIVGGHNVAFDIQVMRD